MTLTDGLIVRMKIRDLWNEANGKGAPWGQQAVIDGKSVDLGQFYEYVALADPEHGLEAVDIDIKQNHGGDGALTRRITSEDLVNLLLRAVAEDVAAIKAKIGA